MLTGGTWICLVMIIFDCPGFSLIKRWTISMFLKNVWSSTVFFFFFFFTFGHWRRSCQKPIFLSTWWHVRRQSFRGGDEKKEKERCFIVKLGDMACSQIPEAPCKLLSVRRPQNDSLLPGGSISTFIIYSIYIWNMLLSQRFDRYAPGLP